MIERKFKPWMSALNGTRVQTITTERAIELAEAYGQKSEIIRLTNLRDRGSVFLDLGLVLNRRKR